MGQDGVQEPSGDGFELISVTFLEPQMIFLVFWGISFWTSSLTHFGQALMPLWGSILGPDGPKRGQEGASEAHPELQRRENIDEQTP